MKSLMVFLILILTVGAWVLSSAALPFIAEGSRSTHVTQVLQEPDPQKPDEVQEEKKHKFVGTKSCKLCHMRSSMGAQYKTWAKFAHSKAFKTLGTDEAKKIAAEKGLGDPQKEADCLRCHVTGHGQPEELFEKDYKVEEGITCEACHGAGADYFPEEKHTGEASKSKEFGLEHPTEETCKKCHNKESPTYKEFDFKTSWKKIDHSIPKKD